MCVCVCVCKQDSAFDNIQPLVWLFTKSNKVFSGLLF